MNHKILPILLFILLFAFSPKTAKALNQAEAEQLSQQVQILKQEALIFKALLSGLNSQRKITAQSYLAINLSDNSTVLSKNPNKLYPIASITKLMNALVALENINTDRTITLNEEMLKPLGSSPAFFIGSSMSAESLVKASLIQSSNDASEALAQSMGKEKFLNLMNQKAKEIGMNNTVFYDVHGLSPKNRSTSADLAKLLAYIYKERPEILNITRNDNFWLPDRTGKLVKFKNINGFYPLAYFIGGKTGYISEAKQTLASVFNISGKPVAVIVLQSDNYLADVSAIIKNIK